MRSDDRRRAGARSGAALGRRSPPAVDRLISSGLPRPSSTGPGQVTALFPAPAWTLLAGGPVNITAAPAGGDPTIPGYHAVLRQSPSTATDRSGRV